MKHYILSLLCLIALGTAFRALPTLANDAAWNGWVEIGDGPDPEPDPEPEPPDPPDCVPGGPPDPDPDPEPPEDEKPECKEKDNKEKPKPPKPEKPDKPKPECPKSKGSPIYMQNGCYVESFVDTRFPTKGPWLVVSRAYNSQDIHNGIFGYGWTSHNSIQLFYTSDGSNNFVTIRLGDGRRAQFSENSDGSYTPRRVLFDFDLSGNSSTGWTLNEKCTACSSSGGPRMEFDHNGFLLSVSDDSGNTLSYDYDLNQNRLISVSDMEGSQLLYSYNEQGKVSHIDTPGSLRYSYLYDRAENLIAVINPLSYTNQYEYDSQHRLVAIVNPEDQVTVQIEYDNINRVTRYTEFGKTMNLTYSFSPAKWTRETNADNSSQTYYYNSQAVITKIEYRNKYNQLQGTADFSLDDKGNVTRYQDLNGYVTQYIYDDYGNIIQKIDALDQLHQYAYDDSHNRIEYTDPAGRVTSYAYTSQNLVERIDYPSGQFETFSYDASGLLLSQLLKNGITYQYTYDENGNITSETEIGITSSLSRTKTYTYNEFGQSLTESDYNGNVSKSEYDKIGRLIRTIYPDAGTNNIFYNRNSQIINTVFEDGTVIGQAYDSWARLASKTYNSGYWEKYTYNNMGLPEYTYTPGRTNLLSYNVYGKLISQKLNEYTLDIERDKLGNVLRQYDSIGNIFSTVYDPLYRKYQTKNGAGDTTTHYYDSINNKIASKDPEGNIVSNFYNIMDLVEKTSSPLGGWNFYVYDQYGRLLQETNALGSVVLYSYDDLSRVSKKEYSDGSSEEYTYDLFGNTLSQTKRNGALYSFTYNGQNNVTSVTNPDGSVSTNIYTSFGRIKKQINAIGNSKIYLYNDSSLPEVIIEPGGMTNTYAYNYYDQPILITDSLNNHTYKSYDARGRLIMTLKKADDTGSEPMPEDWRVEYVHDIRGRVVQKIENGVTNSYTFDLANRQLSITFQLGHSKSFKYDKNGKIIKETLPNGNIINRVFNGFSQLTKADDSIGTIVEKSYNTAGLMTKELTQGAIQKTYAYDVFGRPTRIYDGYSNVATHVYYPGENLKYLINRKGQTNTFYYDAFDRLTAKYDGNGFLTKSNVYNSVGSVLEKIDADGNVTACEYDGAGRLLKVTWPNATYRQQKYDPIGNLIQLIDEDGQTINYEYDAFNQLTKVDFPDNNDNYIFYDQYGNRSCISNAASTSYFTYDTSKRIRTINQDGYLITYEGSPQDNWLRINYPGGKVLTKTMDARRRVIDVSDLIDNFVYLKFDNHIVDFATNGNGWVISPAFGSNFEITNMVYSSGAKKGVNLSYIRDKIDHKAATLDDLFPTNSYVFSYDQSQRLVGFDQGLYTGNHMTFTNFSRVFEMDKAANITNLVTDGLSQQRAYNQLNQLTEMTGNTLLYDQRGNLTNDGLRSYFFDYDDQLIKIVEAGVVILSNSYDVANRLVTKTTLTDSRRFIYDGNNVIEEYLISSPTVPDKEYILSGGLDSLIAYQHAGHTYFYQVDDNQSILSVTDENGDVVERYKYSAYGEPTILDGNNNPIAQSSINNTRLYTGRRWIPEADIYYYRARYYSATLKHYLSRDPAGDVDTLNLYLYVYANPINFIDPLGLISVEGKDGYPKLEADGDCVKTTNGVKFDGRKVPGMKTLFPNPAEITIEFMQNICKKCCPKDSKHPGKKKASINHGLSISAQVSTGWVPVPSLSITIPKVTTVGLSVKLEVTGSFGLEFGHDSCYDSFTGGGEGSLKLTAGACVGAGSCEESDDKDSAFAKFSLTLTAEMSGTIKASLKNMGSGFVFKLEVCFEAELAAKAEVELFWGWAKASHSISIIKFEETCTPIVEKKW